MQVFDLSGREGAAEGNELNAWEDYKDFCAALSTGEECEDQWSLCTLEQLCPFNPVYPSPPNKLISPDGQEVFASDKWVPYLDPVEGNAACTTEAQGLWVQLGNSFNSISGGKQKRLCGNHHEQVTSDCPPWGDDIIGGGIKDRRSITDYVVCCGCAQEEPQRFEQVCSS
jgi:hypothetical protein